eukprot:364776-Chlamydomonas_euryale.AAC.7
MSLARAQKLAYNHAARCCVISLRSAPVLLTPCSSVVQQLALPHAPSTLCAPYPCGASPVLALGWPAINAFFTYTKLKITTHAGWNDFASNSAQPPARPACWRAVAAFKPQLRPPSLWDVSTLPGVSPAAHPARRVSWWRSAFHKSSHVHKVLVVDEWRREEPRVTGWRVVRWGLTFRHCCGSRDPPTPKGPCPVYNVQSTTRLSGAGKPPGAYDMTWCFTHTQCLCNSSDRTATTRMTNLRWLGACVCHLHAWARQDRPRCRPKHVATEPTVAARPCQRSLHTVKSAKHAGQWAA